MHAPVLAELRSIHPLDAVEREHLSDAIAWVESGAPIYRVSKPATPAKHLVSYFAVIDEDHILLVDHKNAQLWLPSGGHVEQDENPRYTVVRELKEELGISIALEAVGPPWMVTVSTTVGMTVVHTDVSIWYAVSGQREAVVEYDRNEFNEVRWFKFSEAPFHRSDPHLARFLTKLQTSTET